MEQDKTILVTGSSRGIGKEIARVFGLRGYRVVINYFESEQEALSLQKELSQYTKVIAVKADIRQKKEVDAMVKEGIETFGNIDVLVNNAGVAYSTLTIDMSEEEIDHVFDVNIKGMFYAAQAVLPSMIHHKKGKIINISSVWGVVGGSMEVHYSASKAAVIGFTRALAKEMAPSGIQVNCVAPGLIDTRMISQLGPETIEELVEATPLGRIGKPIDVAESVWFLASSQADFITGQVLSPNGGFII